MDKAKVYIQEANTQIVFAKRSYESFRNAYAMNDIPSIFLYVHHFLIHATNIDKLLDVDPDSFRGKLILSKFDLSGIDLRPFRRLRNHLEHFDERLDNWVKNYDGHAFFDMNLVTGTKGFPHKEYLRALDGNIFKFHGEDYNLTELYDRIISIEKKIRLLPKETI